MKRYDIDEYDGGMVPDKYGEFAKYDDVSELVKMLQDLEFIQVETDYGTHEYCPVCEQQFHKGHSKDCRLHKMIKEWEGNHAD